jgi:hypothetical protein
MRAKTPLALLLLAASAAGSLAAAEISLTVNEPAGVACVQAPVTSGVPLAAGVLRDPAAARLRAAGGREIPLQTAPLARWPDGSVKWLLLDFQTDLAPRESRAFSLVTPEAAGAENATAGAARPPSPLASGTAAAAPSSPAAEPAAQAGATLRVTQAAGRTVIVTGPLRLELEAAAFDPLGAVWLDRNHDGAFADDERVTAPAGGLFVRDLAGRRFESRGAPAEIVVEESGPERACVRVSGRHGAEGGTRFGYVFRLHAFRGQPFVRCSYTFTNDDQDAVMTSIAELGLATRLAAAAGQPGPPQLGGEPAGAGRIFQRDENTCERDGRASHARAPGWAAVPGERSGFALGVREFWQQWPKALEARDGALTVGLCPAFPAGLYDGRPLAEENKLTYALRRGAYTFKVGVEKTHELTAVFFAAPPEPAALDAFFRAAETPLLATSAPAYVDATGVAGRLPPADPAKFSGYDAWFERAFADHLKRRESGREYGLLNYGDWFGERQVNWGNLEYDLQRGLFLHYLRTGDRRFFDRAAQASRHHLDVDVVHAVNPHLKNPFGAPPQAGQIWLHSLNHTGGYFSNAPLPVDRTYQMGHSANYGHVWISGDLDYYFLTGDRRAREVALLVADTMSAQMVGKVGTHIRNQGWPMILVLSAYDATGEPRYLAAARRNWEALRESLDWQRGWVVKLASDHCLHPAGSTQLQRDTIYKDQRCEGNVPFMEGLTLCALARYHRASGDPEVLRAITVGIDQMIRECWLPEQKTFRYTACPLSSKTYYELFMLSAEAMAYEVQQTGNAEHRRILREGFAAAVAHGPGGFGKAFAQMSFFAPLALWSLE